MQISRTHGRTTQATDLHTELWCAAHWIWERRETAKAAGFAFSEETITETVLLDLAARLSHEIHIVPFNKRQEAETGADWEWCFYDKVQGKYLRFLMQAKLLDNKDKRYAHIDRYIGNSGEQQIERLLATSVERGIPALYAFYNHLSDPTRVPVSTCGCMKCLKCWGATVAIAAMVDDLLPDKSFDKLSTISIPWACLLCPYRSQPADRFAQIIDAFDILRNRGLEQVGTTGLKDVIRPRIEENPPSYFGNLIETHHDQRLEPLLREKLAAENPGVDGVILVNAATEAPR